MLLRATFWISFLHLLVAVSSHPVTATSTSAPVSSTSAPSVSSTSGAQSTTRRVTSSSHSSPSSPTHPPPPPPSHSPPPPSHPPPPPSHPPPPPSHPPAPSPSPSPSPPPSPSPSPPPPFPSPSPSPSPPPASPPPPASSTTSLPASSSSSSPSSSFTVPPPKFPPGVKNPKRGISYASGGNTGDILNANQTKSSISWIYDWSDLPAAYISQSGLQYIPMQWGSGNIDKLASAVSAQGANVILGFNEPDFVNEANIDPKSAAELWMQFIEPLKQNGIKLGGPAVTAAPSGKEWLTEFLNQCGSCTIDFLPLHWYGSGVEGFFNYIWDIHSTFSKYPIWITEFADISENSTVVQDFMNQSINYLDSLDWVERYAWFGFFRPQDKIFYNFLNEDGSLNDLGKLYIGANTVHTSNRTDNSGPQYKTLSPSDQPGQPLVTSWPVMNAANLVVPWSVLQGVVVTSAFLFGVLMTLA